MNCDKGRQPCLYTALSQLDNKDCKLRSGQCRVSTDTYEVPVFV